MRYLPGILLSQLVVAFLVWLNYARLPQPDALLNVILPSLAVAIVVGFWFAALSQRINTQYLDAAKQQHQREREDLRVKAEREKADVEREAEQAKAKVEREAHRSILQESRKTHARANLKVGVALTGAIVFGVVMMFTQLASLGLILLSGAGGALAGYMAQFRRKNRDVLENEIEVLPPADRRESRQFSLPRLIKRS